MNNERNKGFTLVEVVIACTVFAIGLMGVFGLAGWIRMANDYSSKMTIATTLAQAKLEEIMNSSFTLIAAGSESSESFDTSWDVETLNADLKSLVVQTSWQDIKGLSHHVELRCLVSQ